jgi:hypothetical protein
MEHDGGDDEDVKLALKRECEMRLGKMKMSTSNFNVQRAVERIVNCFEGRDGTTGSL